MGEVEAEWIVKEYDSNEDSFLDIDEFSQMILPSTNQALRQKVEKRPYEDLALPEDLCKSIAELIEKEAIFQQKRDMVRRNLLG